MNFTQELQQELDALRIKGNLRHLPRLEHDERYVTTPDGRRMLNLSSNDYLGLAANTDLRREFLETLTPETFLPTSSSSRLLTGNFRVYDELEDELARLFGTEAALVFNCGYHANTGILPAVADAQTLILADKLVASVSLHPSAASATATTIWRSWNGSSVNTAASTTASSSSPKACSAWTATAPTCAAS